MSNPYKWKLKLMVTKLIMIKHSIVIVEEAMAMEDVSTLVAMVLVLLQIKISKLTKVNPRGIGWPFLLIKRMIP